MHIFIHMCIIHVHLHVHAYIYVYIHTYVYTQPIMIMAEVDDGDQARLYRHLQAPLHGHHGARIRRDLGGVIAACIMSVTL